MTLGTDYCHENAEHDVQEPLHLETTCRNAGMNLPRHAL